MKKLIVLVVTYNRKSLLVQSLRSILEQTYNITEILVVDNNSTDGTPELLVREEYLDNYIDTSEIIQSKLLRQSNSNIVRFSYVRKMCNDGGAGGFYWGLNYVCRNDFDWVWVMDDDAILDPSTIQNLMEYSNDKRIAALTATVVDKVGVIDFAHRKRIGGGVRKMFINVPEQEYSNDYFDLDLYSYVGTCIKVSALRSAGLPRKEFFIYYDDTEHSIRVRKVGLIRNVCNSIVHHQIELSKMKRMTSNWKIYYQYRNSLRTYKAHFKVAFIFLYLEVISKMIISALLLHLDYSKMLFKAIRDV